jgi:hypothetical protein
MTEEWFWMTGLTTDRCVECSAEGLVGQDCQSEPCKSIREEFELETR